MDCHLPRRIHVCVQKYLFRAVRIKKELQQFDSGNHVLENERREHYADRKVYDSYRIALTPEKWQKNKAKENGCGSNDPHGALMCLLSYVFVLSYFHICCALCGWVCNICFAQVGLCTCGSYLLYIYCTYHICICCIYWFVCKKVCSTWSLRHIYPIKGGIKCIVSYRQIAVIYIVLTHINRYILIIQPSEWTVFTALQKKKKAFFLSGFLSKVNV